MFTERQKLEREYLRELTKIGDLLDSSRINYFVLGTYSLSARGIHADFNENYLVVKLNNKKRIIEKMFKLNFTLVNANDHLEFVKDTKAGELNIKICLEKEGKIKLNEKEITLLEDSFDNERIEVPSLMKSGKLGSGYFKVSKLEEVYFLWLGERTNLLLQIKNSGKLNFDRLIKLLEVNGKL